MLQMHAQCFKKLEKTEEYIQMVLKILAKWVEKKRTLSLRDGRAAFRGATLEQSVHDLGTVGSRSYLEDLLLSSKDMKQQVSVRMSNYFGPVSVDPYIRHYADKDGFQLQLRLHYLLPESMQAQQVIVRLVSCGEGQLRDIWLAADEAQLLEPGNVKVTVGSKVCKRITIKQKLAHTLSSFSYQGSIKWTRLKLSQRTSIFTTTHCPRAAPPRPQPLETLFMWTSLSQASSWYGRNPALWKLECLCASPFTSKSQNRWRSRSLLDGTISWKGSYSYELHLRGSD